MNEAPPGFFVFLVYFLVMLIFCFYNEDFSNMAKSRAYVHYRTFFVCLCNNCIQNINFWMKGIT
jgi:hypothetical protein